MKIIQLSRNYRHTCKVNSMFSKCQLRSNAYQRNFLLKHITLGLTEVSTHDLQSSDYLMKDHFHRYQFMLDTEETACIVIVFFVVQILVLLVVVVIFRPEALQIFFTFVSSLQNMYNYILMYYALQRDIDVCFSGLKVAITIVIKPVNVSTCVFNF